MTASVASLDDHKKHLEASENVNVSLRKDLEVSREKLAASELALAASSKLTTTLEEQVNHLNGNIDTIKVQTQERELEIKAKEIASPISDMRGTVEHRKDLIEVLTKRTLSKAVERVGV